MNRLHGMTTIPYRIVTQHDLTHFLWRHGAKMVVVRDKAKGVQVEWYGHPSAAYIRARLEGLTVAGVTFDLRARGSWWAFKRLMVAALRVLVSGRLSAP